MTFSHLTSSAHLNSAYLISSHVLPSHLASSHLTQSHVHAYICPLQVAILSRKMCDRCQPLQKSETLEDKSDPLSQDEDGMQLPRANRLCCCFDRGLVWGSFCDVGVVVFLCGGGGGGRGGGVLMVLVWWRSPGVLLSPKTLKAAVNFKKLKSGSPTPEIQRLQLHQ